MFLNKKSLTGEGFWTVQQLRVPKRKKCKILGFWRFSIIGRMRISGRSFKWPITILKNLQRIRSDTMERSSNWKLSPASTESIRKLSQD